MNKIFKIIWSKARNCYVVVSELAKSHDDGHVRRSRSGCGRKAAVLTAFVLTTSLATVPVWAADSKGNINNVVTIKDNQQDISVMAGSNNLNGTGNVVYGTDNTADKSGAVIVGKNSKGDKDSVIIGNDAQSNAENQIIIGHGIANGTAEGSIIIGNTNNTVDTSQSVLIGNNTKANGSGKGIVIIGNEAMADSKAAGYTDNGKYIPAGIVLGEYSYSNTRAGKEGFLSNKKGDKPSEAYTPEYWNAVWKATANPMAIGNVDTDANGKGEEHNGHGVLTRQITGVAAGTDLTDAVNVAQLQAAIAQFSGGGSGTSGDGVHYYSVFSNEQGPGSNYDNKGATGTNALAAGVSASATGAHSVAVGNGATAKGQDSIALGTGAVADGIGATAIGQYNTASGQNSLAFGGGYNKDQKGNTASGVASVAFGEGTQAIAEGTLAFGENTQAGSTEKDNNNNPLGQNAVAFGNGTKATGGRSLAFGERTLASANDATAFGERTVASGESATAFGSDSTAEGKNSLAFGEGSKALGDNSLAGLGGTAAADDSIALGRSAQAGNKDTLAIGNGAKALTGKDIAIGYGAEASGNLTDTSTYNYPAIAIGDDTSVKASESVAIGKANVIERADGEVDLAGANILGHNNTVKASGVAVIGNNNSVTDPGNHDVMILGNLVTKTTDNSVFLGSGSAYTSESKSTKGKSKTYTSDRIGGATLTYAGGAVTAGVVSVGSPEATRRIQNVAPGLLAEASTDAVNGSQLYAVANVAAKNTEILGKGLKFKGDNDTVITKKLNEQLDIVGGADAKKLTDKNIGVNNVGGQLKIQLAKKIDLGEEGSVKTGDTIINNNGLTIKNGPTITKTNVSMNNQQIHNVAAGKKGTDAVNVDQLNEVQTLASQHTKVTVEGGTAPKGTTYVGKNLKINVTDNKGQKTYDLKLADNLSIGEKGADGKDGKIGVNGKDGSSVVINGKDGTIGLNSKDGTNGLTIRGAAGKPGVDGKDGITRIVYKDAAGKDHPVANLDDGLNFKGDDGTVISKKLNQRMDIVGGANKNNLSENNIGVISDNGKLHVKLAKDLKGLTSVTTTDGNGNTTVQNGKGVTVKDGQNNTATFTAKDITFTNRDKSRKTKLDEDGLTIFTKGASGQANQTIKITNTYISMGGQQIHNVSAGKADTDAVNVSQLKAVQSVAEAHSTVSVGGKKAGKDSVDVKGGNLVLKRTENKNGSKNYDVKLADDISIKSVTTTDDKGNKTVQKGSGITTIDKDGNKTSVTGKGVTTVDKDGNKTSLTGKGMTTVDKEGNKTSVTGKGVSIFGKDGNKTTITEKGLTIKDGPVVTKDKFSAGGQQIHDVKAGTAPTDAVNVSQLKDEIGKVEQHHTEVTVNGGTEAQEGTYNTSGNLQIKKTTDKDGKKTYDLKLADNLTFGAQDGADGSIGVNGKNGSAVVINGKDGSIGLNGADGKNGLTIKGADGTVGVDGKAGTTRLIYETKDGETTVKHEVATMDDGMKYSGDSGNAAVKLNKNVQIYGGATEYADGNNIGVVASQDGDNAKLQVKLAKDLKGINSIEAKTITTGNTTINNNGLTIKTGDENRNITVQDGNVNMGGNQIHNVAPGQAPGDAVNVSQLNATNSAVNKLGNRINRVGAGAAALAALHPLDFDPDDKWDFAAGYGNYRGANAAAIGAYYRPNEDTMFSVGGSFGGGENMVNAGVSIKLGQGNHVSTSRVAMAKEMKAMRQHMAEQDALIAKLQSMHGMAVDPAKSVLFPDVAENHWAYQYVTTLAKKGILEGYPDGEFKGDRMMTRYEFAAIVYRIVESGVGSTDPELSKLVKEFSPELQYIRIDTIQKDRNGKPTIERVRVISDAK